MQDFRNLKVWEKAHQLTLAVYQATAKFPKEELFGLTSQTRRSVASIPTNIAEGCGRGSDADFGRFLQMAAGSASEIDYQLLLARGLGYLGPESYVDLTKDLAEVRRMLAKFIQRLKPA